MRHAVTPFHDRLGDSRPHICELSVLVFVRDADARYRDFSRDKRVSVTVTSVTLTPHGFVSQPQPQQQKCLFEHFYVSLFCNMAKLSVRTTISSN
jgi:hypothetical protein